MPKNIIIFDLDGTIANCDHRRYLVDPTNPNFPGKKDWDRFADLSIHDTPNGHVHIVYTQLSRHKWGYDMVIWSGRDERMREKTVAWLKDCGIDDYLELRMRPHGDHTPDNELKQRWLDEVGKESVLMVFDDRDRMVEMWRSNGIPCFQVAKGDF